jgi:hypothetical protein
MSRLVTLATPKRSSFKIRFERSVERRAMLLRKFCLISLHMM